MMMFADDEGFTQTHRARPGRLAARLRVNVLLVISGLATSSPLCSFSFFSWSSARIDSVFPAAAVAAAPPRFVLSSHRTRSASRHRPCERESSRGSCRLSACGKFLRVWRYPLSRTKSVIPWRDSFAIESQSFRRRRRLNLVDRWLEKLKGALFSNRVLDKKRRLKNQPREKFFFVFETSQWDFSSAFRVKSFAKYRSFLSRASRNFSIFSLSLFLLLAR